MALQFLNNFLLTNDWQYTEPIDTAYNVFNFSNTFATPAYYQTAIIAQVNASNDLVNIGTEFFGFKRLYGQEQGSLLILEPPAHWLSRRIAIRRNRRFSKAPDWHCSITVDLDSISPINYGFTAFTNVVYIQALLSPLLLPKNAKRVGAIVQNLSTPDVYIGFDDSLAFGNQSAIIKQSEYYYIPEGYKGPVYGKCEIINKNMNPFGTPNYAESRVQLTTFSA